MTPAEISGARSALGITQAQAGAIIGWTRRGWQDVELGQKPLSPLMWRVWRHLAGIEAMPFVVRVKRDAID